MTVPPMDGLVFRAPNLAEHGEVIYALLAQLLIGTYPPLETVRSAGMSLDGEAQALVQVLFPHQHPQMPNEDL